MKILLIQPKTNSLVAASDDLYIHEPIALEYVGAVIPEKHEVKLLDSRLEDNFEEVLQSYDPDIVGLTSYIVHVNVVKELCKKIKEYRQDIITIIGGYQATLCPESFDEPYIDALVIGEGLNSFREIVEYTENGLDLINIKGAALQRDGKLVFTEPREYSSLETFPTPRRDLTAHLRDKYFNESIQPLASIITSKGCPFRCKFCTPWRQTGGKYLTRTPESIVAELKTIKEPFVHIADDESFVDAKRMENLAELIKEEGIDKKYYMYVRSDTVHKHPELLKKWYDVGLRWVYIGFESQREQDLKDYNKQNSKDTNEIAITILKDIGVKIYGSFIVNPNFEEKDFDDLYNYTKELEIDNVYYTVLTPTPGTELYDELKDSIICNNYSFYDFLHAVTPTKLPLFRFYSEFAYLFYRTGKHYSKNQSAKRAELDTKIYAKIKNAYKHYENEVQQ